MSYFDDVSQFQQQVLKRQPLDRPHMPSKQELIYVVACLQEELDEMMEAVEQDHAAGVVDALADGIYFALGCAFRMGIPFDRVWNAVHQANMRKELGVTHRGVAGDAAKPKNWVDPKVEIQRILEGG